MTRERRSCAHVQGVLTGLLAILNLIILMFSQFCLAHVTRVTCITICTVPQLCIEPYILQFHSPLRLITHLPITRVPHANTLPVSPLVHELVVRHEQIAYVINLGKYPSWVYHGGGE